MCASHRTFQDVDSPWQGRWNGHKKRPHPSIERTSARMNVGSFWNERASETGPVFSSRDYRSAAPAGAISSLKTTGGLRHRLRSRVPPARVLMHLPHTSRVPPARVLVHLPRTSRVPPARVLVHTPRTSRVPPARVLVHLPHTSRVPPARGCPWFGFNHLTFQAFLNNRQTAWRPT